MHFRSRIVLFGLTLSCAVPVAAQTTSPQPPKSQCRISAARPRNPTRCRFSTSTATSSGAGPSNGTCPKVHSAPTAPSKARPPTRSWPMTSSRESPRRPDLPARSRSRKRFAYSRDNKTIARSVTDSRGFSLYPDRHHWRRSRRLLLHLLRQCPIRVQGQTDSAPDDDAAAVAGQLQGRGPDFSRRRARDKLWHPLVGTCRQRRWIAALAAGGESRSRAQSFYLNQSNVPVICTPTGTNSKLLGSTAPDDPLNAGGARKPVPI